MNYAIGIDIGGTNTDIGLVTQNGTIIDKINIKVDKYTDAQLFVRDMCDGIKTLLQRQNIAVIDGIGIGAPNGNTYTGCIDNAPNLKMKGNIELANMVRQYFNTKVVVSNDANAAAFGEKIYGGAKNLKHFITFTLGTGVGSGIVIDGNLLLGATSTAGELGHVIMVPQGRQCGCGRRGCLETYTSAGGIVATARELLESDKEYDGVLRRNAGDLTSKMIGDAANDGDPLAVKVFEKVGWMLGLAMANAVAFSVPEAIFLMGGPVHAGEVLLKPLRKSFEENLLYIYKDKETGKPKIEIKVSSLKDNDVAILGAAALIQMVM